MKTPKRIQSKPNDRLDNPELRDLATHVAGAVRLHETINTERPVRIDPPIMQTFAAEDERLGIYDLQRNKKE